MCRGFFVNDKYAIEIASLFFVIENLEELLAESAKKKSIQHQAEDDTKLNLKMRERQDRLDATFLNYIPVKTYKRLMKSKEVVIAELKAKVSERFLKNEYNNLIEMKSNLLNIFSKFPEFCSSNYIGRSK